MPALKSVAVYLVAQKEHRSDAWPLAKLLNDMPACMLYWRLPMTGINEPFDFDHVVQFPAVFRGRSMSGHRIAYPETSMSESSREHRKCETQLYRI